MTGAEVIPLLATAGGTAAGTAAAAGTGAAIAGTATAITAAEAAALGMTAAEGAAAASAGMTAAEVAAAQAGTAAAGAEAATAGGGLLAPEAAAAAPETTGLLAEQAPAQLVDQSTQAGMFDKLNYQSNGMLGETKDWLGKKPMGDSGPSRGKLLQQGGRMATGQEQQQPAPQARPVGGQFHPSAQGSPYAPQQMNGTAAPPQFLSMADFLRQRGY